MPKDHLAEEQRPLSISLCRPVCLSLSQNVHPSLYQHPSVCLLKGKKKKLIHLSSLHRNITQLHIIYDYIHFFFFFCKMWNVCVTCWNMWHKGGFSIARFQHVSTQLDTALLGCVCVSIGDSTWYPVLFSKQAELVQNMWSPRRLMEGHYR